MASLAQDHWEPEAKAPAASILEAERLPVTRYRRRAIVAIVGVLAGVLAIGLIVAFALPRTAEQGRPRDLGAIQAAKPELKGLPTGYSDPRAQRPGPAGPGAAPMPPPSADIGLASSTGSDVRTTPPAAQNTVILAAAQKREAARDAAARQDLAARTAPVLVDQPAPAAEGSNPSPTADSGTLGSSAPAVATAEFDPNGQGAKQDFIARGGIGSDYLANRLTPPVSPYEIKAGTIIPAALITALNSDLPGAVVASVTENVFDHVTGQTLLIPQGARLFGRYDSKVSYGQDRALVIWDRLIFPDGRAINLAGMTGTDAAGAAGLSDRVDNHLGSLLRGILLSTAISIGGAVADDASTNRDNLVLQGGAGAVAQDASRTGQEFVRRQLDRQPTITVRPGYRLRVLVNKDMVLAPY